MYTLEDRMRAVNLYFKYGGSSAAVRRELGYPTKNALKQWVKEYEVGGALHDGYRGRPPKYSKEQKQSAVDYYLEHGRSRGHRVVWSIAPIYGQGQPLSAREAHRQRCCRSSL